MLTDAARGWAQEVLGRPVVEVARLSGGVASRMLLLRADDGREAVLRQLLDDPWRAHAAGLLHRERDVHGLLQGTDVPVPRTLGVDACGDEAGDPSLLMTRVPGVLDLVEAGPARLGALADLLLSIHRVEPAPGSSPRDYQSWAAHDAPYLEAFDRLRAPAPSYAPTFLHRDFHPGNVLWERGRVTGVVDWVETSTGPADLDVAHCASHLAGLHGVEVALAFRRAYVDHGGVLAQDPDAVAYWQLLDLVAFLPDAAGREGGAAAAVVEAVWAAHGRGDLGVEAARRRREDLLRVVLGH